MLNNLQKELQSAASHLSCFIERRQSSNVFLWLATCMPLRWKHSPRLNPTSCGPCLRWRQKYGSEVLHQENKRAQAETET